jgi:hypothetical protein
METCIQARVFDAGPPRNCGLTARSSFVVADGQAGLRRRGLADARELAVDDFCNHANKQDADGDGIGRSRTSYPRSSRQVEQASRCQDWVRGARCCRLSLGRVVKLTHYLNSGDDRRLRDQFAKNRGRWLVLPPLYHSAYNWFTEGFDIADLKEAKALLDELAG